MRISHHQDTSEQPVKAAFSRRSARSEEMLASSGVTFRLWRLYQHAWLVCLAFPLVALVREPISPQRFLLGLLTLLGFAVSYTWLMWPHPASQGTRTRSWGSFLLLGVLSVLTLVFSLMDGPAWFWLFIGVSAIAGILLPMSKAFAAVVLFTLLPLFLALGTRGENVAIDWWWLLALMLLIRGLGLDMIGVARMGNAIRELQIARRELARLAVIEERERLARDLHDLLGHTLSVITLKSELAGCLVTEEPGRCIRELADIERVSRQMLRKVRKTVTGYRQPTLANELDGARQLLEAARVACVVEQTIEDFPPALDATLAWTVREGATNVIRHSRARQCLIRLASDGSTRERVCVEVLNDGVLPDNQRKGQYEGQGSGLSGLRERVAMFGGNMEAGFLTGSGKEQFRLWVALPVQMDGETVGVLAGMQENGG